MTNKKMPTINSWFQEGTWNARSGKTLAECESEFTVKPTPHQLADFRSGYHTGRIMHAIDYIRSMARYANRDELIAIADTLEPLVLQWEHDYFGLTLKMPGLRMPEWKELHPDEIDPTPPESPATPP